MLANCWCLLSSVPHAHAIVLVCMCEQRTRVRVCVFRGCFRLSRVHTHTSTHKHTRLTLYPCSAVDVLNGFTPIRFGVSFVRAECAILAVLNLAISLSLLHQQRVFVESNFAARCATLTHTYAHARTHPLALLAMYTNTHLYFNGQHISHILHTTALQRAYTTVHFYSFNYVRKFCVESVPY